MTVQMTKMGDNSDRLIGWLTWWTLKKGEYKLETVQQAAADRKVPSSIQERLGGRTVESAWKAATQLGSTGVPLPGGGPDVSRRLVTRNAVPGDSSIRALVIEVTDPNGNIEEWVTAKTAAMLELGADGLVVQTSQDFEDDEYSDTILQVIDGMKEHMRKIVGAIDDGRIRSAVLAWLEEKYRVTVRGAGGVYLIPATSKSRDADRDDLLAIRDWLDTISSPFSVVALTERGAHSIDDFISDAVDEIKDELADIGRRLKKWQANARMNAGSRNFSSKTQMDKIEGVAEKVGALKEALGEEIGVVDEMVALTEKRIRAMMTQSARQMGAAKAQRTKAKKAAVVAKEARQEAAKKAKAAKAESKKKKAGTAKQRTAKKKL